MIRERDAHKDLILVLDGSLAELKVKCHSSPRLSLTIFLHLFRNSLGSSRHIFAASTFAGLSSFGELNKLITLSNIVSGLCTGDQRSLADSKPYLSSSGGCNMDMHTSPFEYTNTR